MQPITAHEAFWNWATKFLMIAAGLSLAVCLAVVVTALAFRRGKEVPRDD